MVHRSPFQINVRQASIGKAAEHKAAAFLEKQGLKLIASRYRAPAGEIDLIMEDHQTLVFIEVKFRKHTHFGTAAESVHTRKQQKILKAALLYLQKTKQFEKRPCRFDVVALSPNHIEWIKNAF